MKLEKVTEEDTRLVNEGAYKTILKDVSPARGITRNYVHFTFEIIEDNFKGEELYLDISSGRILGHYFSLLDPNTDKDNYSLEKLKECIGNEYIMEVVHKEFEGQIYEHVEFLMRNEIN